MNGDKPYFHIEYIMDHIFKLTPEEKAENAKYWAKDITNAGAQATGEVGESEFGGGGDFGAQSGGDFGAQSDTGADITPPDNTPPDTGDAGTEFEF